MDYNIINGGLLLNIEGKLIVSNLKKYLTESEYNLDSMFWFMNFEGSNIFYSDQRRKNALYRMDINEKQSYIIVNKPCYGVLLFENWLYYINEDDENIYRCSTNGKDETRVVNEKVRSFIIEEGQIFYATSQGIMTCDELGEGRRTLSDAVAPSLVLIGENLAFPDKNKQYALTILDLRTNNTKTIDQIATSSMNTDGKYLYCANRLNNRSIYRVDPEQGSHIRICGESAEYLHVIENELYFCIAGVWHKMSLEGGQASRVGV